MTYSVTAPFQLGALPTLSRSTADRQEELRNNPERLVARWPDARVLLLDDGGHTPVQVGAEFALSTRKAVSFGDTPPADALFLGEWEGVDYWSLPGNPEGAILKTRFRGSWGVTEEVPEVDGEAWVSLVGYGDLLDDTSAGLFTTALGLRNWHHKSIFCTVCGGQTQRIQFGWANQCQGCGREEYPRTDSAVICLVHDDVGVNGEHVLLAKAPKWPKNRYSILAGFVETGESLEACVEREIREEVGLRVRNVRYLGSQPWPFPRSVMLGFTARADRDAPFTLADGEIEEALWVSREELRSVFEHGQVRSGKAVAVPIAGGASTMLLPGNSSIARVMLRAWADASS